MPEYEPLYHKIFRTDGDGALAGLKPGREYLVMETAGRTMVTPSFPSKIGGQSPSRRKVVAVTALYDPVEPEPAVAGKLPVKESGPAKESVGRRRKPAPKILDDTEN